MLIRRFAILACTVVTIPAVAHSQRCAATPTYAARRVSVGAQFTDVVGGSTGGATFRWVRGNSALEARGERLRASDPSRAAYVRGSSWVGAARRSIPTRDGWTAFCLTAEVGRDRQDFVEPGFTQPTIERSETNATLGVGFAMPAPLSKSRRATILYEVRLSRHWASEALGNGSQNWWQREIAVAAGLALPRNLTATARMSIPIYPRWLEYPAAWRPPRSEQFQFAMLYHFDPTR